MILIEMNLDVTGQLESLMTDLTSVYLLRHYIDTTGMDLLQLYKRKLFSCLRSFEERRFWPFFFYNIKFLRIALRKERVNVRLLPL